MPDQTPIPATDIGLADPEYLASLGQGEVQAAAGLGRAGANALNSIWDFIKVPGDVYGGKYSLDEISRLAPGYALGLATAGTPVGAATLPEESLGLFGGAKSFAIPREALKTARDMDARWFTPNSIYDTTGLFRGPEGLWRYTIPDESARLNPEVFTANPYAPDLVTLQNSRRGVPLGQALQHSGGLYQAYPGLSNYTVRPQSFGDVVGDTLASFNPVTKEIEIKGAKPANVLSSLLHETQHAIQNIEGFPRGGNVEEFLPKDYRDRLADIEGRKQDILKDAFWKHPELSDLDRKELDYILRGHYSSEEKRILGNLSPELQDKVRAVSRDTLQTRLDNMEAYDKYKRLAGEVEARAVQEQLERRDWTTPVWKHEGYIPFEEQIVKPQTPQSPFGFQLIPVDHDPFVGTQ